MPSSTANMWMPPLKRLCCSAKQRWVAGRRVGLETPKQNVPRKSRIGIDLLAAALLAAAAVYPVPRAADAVSGLDDPARIAGRAPDRTFDAVITTRAIQTAMGGT